MPDTKDFGPDDAPPDGTAGRLSSWVAAIRSPGGARWVIRGAFAVAAAVLLLDVVESGALPGGDRRLPGSDEAGANPTAPPTPGDQVRPFSPRIWPRRIRDDAAGMDLPLGPPMEPVRERMTVERTMPVAGMVTALAAGTILPGTAGEVERFLDAHPDVEALMLNSPGGVLQEGMTLADMIFERELTTIVTDDGLCASACPVVLAAGKQRLISADAWIGVHQIFLADENLAEASGLFGTDLAVYDVQRLNGAVIRSFERSGVDPGIWVHALETPPLSMYYLTDEELTGFGLATELL